MQRIAVEVEHDDGARRPLRLDVGRMINMGSATRAADTAVAHQEEVAKHGIHIAFDVPAPRLYPIAVHALTTDDAIGVQTPDTSGEVEIVLVLADRVYVGVGSDHTDRALERTSIPWSKQACANVLAPVLWPLDEVAENWDDCVLRSWVDGRLYQEVGVSAFLRPEEMVRIVRERAPGLPPTGVVLFGGTIVSVDKRLGFGERWSFELADPGKRRRIRHDYRVEQLFDDLDGRFRVPVLNPKAGSEAGEQGGAG